MDPKYNITCFVTGRRDNLRMHAVRNNDGGQIGWLFINEDVAIRSNDFFNLKWSIGVSPDGARPNKYFYKTPEPGSSVHSICMKENGEDATLAFCYSITIAQMIVGMLNLGHQSGATETVEDNLRLGYKRTGETGQAIELESNICENCGNPSSEHEPPEFKCPPIKSKVVATVTAGIVSGKYRWAGVMLNPAKVAEQKVPDTFHIYHVDGDGPATFIGEADTADKADFLCKAANYFDAHQHGDPEPPVTSDADRLEKLFKNWGEYSRVAFPDADTADHIKKLEREVVELKANRDPHEYADVILCVFAAAFKDGLDFWTLFNAVQSKAEINAGRKWIKQSDGTYQHE